jgi:protein-L-isoaspartate O-methyltransferase
MSRVDLEQLAKEISQLERHQELFKVLKKELSSLGYWKNRQRGDPAKGYRERGRKSA